jgi:transcriptional regulator with XRE-family HTH domain
LAEMVAEARPGESVGTGDTPFQAFGEVLRRLRASAGLTQEEVAERAGVSARSIGDIERGVSRVPQKQTVSLLADALKLTGEARVAFEVSARSRGGGGTVVLIAETLRPPDAIGPALSAEECGRLFDELIARGKTGGASMRGQGVLRERVLQRAGGVPFFVVSYAHALGQGDVSRGADRVPWNVAQGVRQRVAALPEQAQALLAAAAVIGRVSQPALLMAVAARPEEDVLAGLEAACRARLLLDAGNVYQFAHDVVREVVEADIGSARRAILHRRAAESIEELSGERLPDYHEVLADHYPLCARLGTTAQETAGAIAEKRGFVCYDNGDFAGAELDFERMRDAAAALDNRRREGLALAYGGMAAYYGHDFATAEERLQAALSVASDGFDDVRLFASVQLSSLYMITDRHTEAAPFLQMAEELSPHVDDPLSTRIPDGGARRVP